MKTPYSPYPENATAEERDQIDVALKSNFPVSILAWSQKDIEAMEQLARTHSEANRVKKLAYAIRHQITTDSDRDHGTATNFTFDLEAVINIIKTCQKEENPTPSSV